MAPIVNELLCYISNQIDLCTTDDLVELCSRFYSEDEIDAARDVIEREPDVEPLRPRRQGPNRKMNTVKDIIKTFHDLGKSIPTFCACDLRKLPPLSFVDCEEATMMKKFENLRAEVFRKVGACQELNEVVKTFNERISRLENQERNCPNPSAAGLNQQRPPVFAPGQPMSPWPQRHPMPPYQPRTPIPLMQNQHPRSPTPMQQAQARVLTPPLVPQTQQQEQSSQQSDQTRATVPHTNLHVINRDIEADEKDDGGPWTRVTRQRRNERPANQNPRANARNISSKARNQREVIGTRASGTIRTVSAVTHVFATRFDPDLTAEDLEKHLSESANFNFQVVKLPTRHNTYSSFHVIVSCTDYEKVYDGSLWPTGALVRPYHQNKRGMQRTNSVSDTRDVVNQSNQ